MYIIVSNFLYFISRKCIFVKKSLYWIKIRRIIKNSIITDRFIKMLILSTFIKSI